jgi:hypothetical protein
MMVVSNNIVLISSNWLHPNSVNWRKWPYQEKENANGPSAFRFSISALLAHWPSSLARNEGKEQVTTGNCSVLQSIIGTSERLIAETLCPVYYCADSLKQSSCATDSHWTWFWQPRFSDCASPKFKSKRWMRKYYGRKNGKNLNISLCDLEVLSFFLMHCSRIKQCGN